MKHCLLVAVVFSLFGLLSPARSQEAILNDGRLWNDMSSQFKTVYLIGYTDAVAFVAIATTKSPSESDQMYRRFYPSGSGTTGAAIVEALDAFYTNPQNLRIGIPWAVQLMAAKVSGVSAGEIEKRTEALRRAAKASSLQ